ncbi:MAG: beta-L-arabinofuranosidase domain-containing protein [Planctomycetota bacterium]
MRGTFLLVLAPFLAAGAGAQTAGRRVVESFDFAGVTLEDGLLKRQVDEVKEYTLRLPNDDLLRGFRARAGRPAPGIDLGGWYGADVFHVFGQILSGLARLHAATGDPDCAEKARALVREWGSCIGEDGFFFSDAPNAPHYAYDKLVGGLVDCFPYCGDAEALAHLDRITDWAIANLDRARPYGADHREWYTLSENLYRAFLATGDETYREFARVWEYAGYWDLFAAGKDIFRDRPDGALDRRYHAYSHVNTLGGAGAAYLATGERRYLDVLVGAYDYLQASQCFAMGGYGPDETLRPRAELIGALGRTHNTFETQCGSWAAFKMCKYLISCTGEARFGDWIERLVYNGIGASVPMSGDGRVFCHSDYNPSGARKRNIDFGWSCCTGTRPQAVADYYDLAFFHDGDSLYVNLYTPSTLRVAFGGAEVTVRQSTRFPAEEEVRFTVDAPGPVRFALKLRAPGWLAGPLEAAAGGERVELAMDRGWAGIAREWRPGDTLEVRLPMRFAALPWTRRGGPRPPSSAARSCWRSAALRSIRRSASTSRTSKTRSSRAPARS